MKIFLSVMSIVVLSYGFVFGGTLRITNESTNPDFQKLWKEKIIPMFEKENPDIKVEMTIYNHEDYKTAIRNWKFDLLFNGAVVSGYNLFNFLRIIWALSFLSIIFHYQN